MEKRPDGVFTRQELAAWLGGSSDRQSGLLRRAMRAQEVIRLRRGMYCLAPRYFRGRVDPLALAQRLYGPSYISLETALSWHGWIPEAVYTTTSVCLQRSMEVGTPIGHFSFVRVPQTVLYCAVRRVEADAPYRGDGYGFGGGRGAGAGRGDGSGHGVPMAVPGMGAALIATPWKALADFVYVHRCDWRSLEPVVESLRVPREALLDAANPNELAELSGNYTSRRVRRFLAGLREEMAA